MNTLRNAGISIILILLIIGGSWLVFQMYDDNSTETNITNEIKENETIEPYERTFVYIVRNENDEIAKTIAQNTYEIVKSGEIELTVQDCIDMEEYTQTKCLRSAATYLNDSSICENALIENGREYCYYNYAVEKADVDACKQINKNSDYEIYAMCMRDTAILVGDPSACIGSKLYNMNEQIANCKKIAESGILVGKEKCRNEITVWLLAESTYFGDATIWFTDEHNGEKVVTWWDYGTTFDCLGTESVISDQDLTDGKIIDVAYFLVDGNETELIEFMELDGAEYLVLQNELIVSSDGLGAKYGALNYLACVRNDETDASNEPGITQCERKNLWEQIYITTQECNISTNNTGNIAYRIYEEDDETEGWKYSAYYPDICLHPDSRSILYCKRYIRTDPVYCIGNVTTKKGYITGTYELNKTDEYGNLEVHKSQIGACKELNGAYHFGNVNSCTLFYTTNEIWLNNDNEYISGYEDRTGDFYDSIIYRGIFLDELDGFEKIYDNAYVKIYQITKRLYI